MYVFANITSNCCYHAQNRLLCDSIYGKECHLFWYFSHFPPGDYGNGNCRADHRKGVVWQLTVRRLGWCPGALRRTVMLCPSDLLRQSLLAARQTCLPTSALEIKWPVSAELLCRTYSGGTTRRHSQVSLLREPAVVCIRRRVRHCSFRLHKWRMAIGPLKSYSASI